MRVEKEHPNISESLYVKSFDVGLKPELLSAVRAHEPGDLYSTIWQAKLQEQVVKYLNGDGETKAKS